MKLTQTEKIAIYSDALQALIINPSSMGYSPGCVSEDMLMDSKRVADNYIKILESDSDSNDDSHPNNKYGH